jgi:hypothetical protein
MEKYNQIFNSIFKQPLSDQNSKALIEKLMQEYPYFSPAQLFLLHLTDKNSISYADEAKKTSLLFNNNYWLNFLVLELSLQKKNSTKINEALPEPITLLPEEAIIMLEAESILPTEAISHIPMALESEAAIIATITLDEQSIEDLPTASEATTFTALSPIEEIVENVPATAEDSFEKNSDIAESHTEPIEAIAEIELTQRIGHTQEAAFKQEQPAGYMQDEDELPVDEDDLPVDEDDLPVDGDELPVDEEMKQVSFKIAEALSAIAIDSLSTKDTISFEPLHTSDYFASVGIKLSEEARPSDKLGLQLKSFTQWLKTMKKVHADQLKETGFTDNQLNVQNDQTIQQLAEASNKENLVVTEAMAEVLVQQGKIIKAIEVYEKLSLLDPSKKAYFAAKLNQLKG